MIPNLNLVLYDIFHQFLLKSSPNSSNQVNISITGSNSHSSLSSTNTFQVNNTSIDETNGGGPPPNQSNQTTHNNTTTFINSVSSSILCIKQIEEL